MTESNNYYSKIQEAMENLRKMIDSNLNSISKKEAINYVKKLIESYRGSEEFKNESAAQTNGVYLTNIEKELADFSRRIQEEKDAR